MHRTGLSSVAQSWRASALQGALGQRRAPLLSLPREEEGRTGLPLRWAVLVELVAAARGSASVLLMGQLGLAPCPRHPPRPQPAPLLSTTAALSPLRTALPDCPDMFSFELPK